MRYNLRADSPHRSPTGPVSAHTALGLFCHHCWGIKHHHWDPPLSGYSVSTHNISTNTTTHNGSGCHFQCKHFHVDQGNIFIYLKLWVNSQKAQHLDAWHLAHIHAVDYPWTKAHILVFFIHSQVLWRKWLQMSLKLCIAERRNFLCYNQREKSQFLSMLHTTFPIVWVTKTINNNNQSTMY